MKKFLVAFVTLAALVLASCSNTFNANDKLATPDVKAEVTDNGVILLKWTPDPNADGNYSVLACYPDSEVFEPINWITISQYYEQKLFEFPCDADKEYKFRVFANAPSKTNLLASDYCEVSITTPKEFVDSDAISADRIEINKVSGTTNRYKIWFPTVAGYNYTYKVVNSNISDAKALFVNNSVKSISTNSWGSSFDEIKGSTKEQVKEKIEDKEVIKAVYINEITIPAPQGTDSIDNENYYVVVKAEPVNKGINQTTKYAVSTACAKYDWNEKTVTPKNISATQINEDTVRVKFSADYILNEPVPADRFTVYYNLTQNVGTQLKPVTEKSQLVKVDGTVVACVNYDGNVTSQTTSKDYYIDVKVNAFDKTGLKAYTYDFFVVASNDNGDDSWTNAANVTIQGQTEWKENNAPSVSSISITQAEKNKVNISYTVSKDATVTATYGKFTTLAAAKAALESEVKEKLTAKAEETPKTTTVSTETVWVDNVKTNYTVTVSPTVTSVKYELKDFALETGKKVVITSEAKDGRTDTISTTTNVGTYYVFRVVASKDGYDSVVQTAIAYITETKNGDSDPTYSLRTVGSNNGSQGGNTDNSGENTGNQGGNQNNTFAGNYYTSDNTVYLYADEYSNWICYLFDEKGNGYSESSRGYYSLEGSSLHIWNEYAEIFTTFDGYSFEMEGMTFTKQ